MAYRRKSSRKTGYQGRSYGNSRRYSRRRTTRRTSRRRYQSSRTKDIRIVVEQVAANPNPLAANPVLQSAQATKRASF